MDSRSLTLAEEKELETGVTSSPQGSIKDEKTELDNTQTDKEDGSIRNQAEAEEDGGEYPRGIRMALIVVSHVISNFLVCFFPILGGCASD